MILTTETLLTTTVHGVPSGFYDGSSEDFFSDVVRAANYYKGQGNLQTITISVTDFVGIIKIQASLNDLIYSALYFDTEEFGDRFYPTTGTYPINVTGSFVWLRAEILGFHQGTINSITVTY